nr:MAG TPA: hypothetical protein [Bacteriophage sp.]
MPSIVIALIQAIRSAFISLPYLEGLLYPCQSALFKPYLRSSNKLENASLNICVPIDLSVAS